MSTIQDFKDAPVGATATNPDGRRAVRTFDLDGERWYATDHYWYTDGELSNQGFTLDPTPSHIPGTACEALDLAWELACPVREGQVIPEGTRYLEIHNTELRETSLPRDIRITHGLVPKVRTIDPLPELEPDWLDAPAVLAAMDDCSWQKVWLPSTPGHWECTCCGVDRHWSKMADVTPLYPKEDKGGMEITGSGDIQFKDRNGQVVWEL